MVEGNKRSLLVLVSARNAELENLVALFCSKYGKKAKYPINSII
jgi:hypothetical protein